MKAKIFLVVLIVLQSAVWARATEEVDYFAVLMDGAKVGYAIHSRSAEGGKVTTTDTVNMTISRLGIPVTITTKETSIETTDGVPLGFEAEQGLGLMTMKTMGTVGRDGVVTTKNVSMGAEQKGTMQWAEGAVMAEGLRLVALKKGLKEGTNFKVKIFSPVLAAAVDANVMVGAKQDVDLLGRVVSLTKVETSLGMPGMGEVPSVSYVDEQFRALKSTMAIMGMTVELVGCEKEFALGNINALEIVNKMFLTSPEPIEDIGSAKAVAYFLRPVAGAGGFVIPAGDNQRVQKMDDGSVIVTVEPVAAPKGARYPYRGTNKNIAEATKPASYLQSGRKEIIELANRAVGNTKDAAEAARRVEAFVADYVDDVVLSVGYASAAEVAASRRGDCTEFAVLCAAMCRAAGIPARVVMGVAYVKDFGGLSGFGGHAWVEAYVGDKWVGLDSAFKRSGRGGFDAGHIALARGDGEPRDFFNLAATLGRFKIEKVMVSRGN
jgi:hypothetical protein